ncbi:alpha-L-rhamnosidase C-terminal domain-containing protein [Lactobacillus sp. ESL0225]|uniref:alpha-L-rhamnosidase-related protein n=1 Tax=Lactobacillus sp. ESL0225 TaxID=2069351 RepID=UPI002101032E|nr:alpha-L-rhamnosidase C-terminal domain-containing protein [Lactobacillus sp. ESL0225]
MLENYDAMMKWHNYSVKSAAADKKGNDCYILDTTFHYGDWMFPSMMIGNPDPMKSAKATKDLVATVFLAHSAILLAKISKLLGKDSNQYIEYANKVKISFTNKFVKAGKLTSDYQGCYVLALAFDMVEDHNLKQQLLARLVELIHDNNDCLDTGFLSVPYLLDVLVDNDEIELAKQLFLQDKCPSWLYEVDHGATTIWESWAGIQPDGKVGTFSFNHYAMGCVLDWFIRNVVGLNVIKPGYKEVAINPKFKGIVNDFQMKYLSVNGLFTIQLRNGIYKFSIPAGCKATIYPPDTDKFLKKYPQASVENTRITVKSGTYQFLIA